MQSYNSKILVKYSVFLALIFYCALNAEAVTVNAVLLNPTGYTSTGLRAGGGYQVGYGNSGGADHALLWNGTAASVVDLHPLAGFTDSYGNGTDGTTQVGDGYTTGVGNPDHALMWTGTAASAVDIHPGAYTDSRALSVSGSDIVGWGYDGSNYHPLLWTGGAGTDVDLTIPGGFVNGYAFANDATSQVGSADTASNTYAMLWTGVSTPTNLNPSGFSNSEAFGVSGGSQVGYGLTTGPGAQHALLWSGTAASAVDLNPAGFTASLANDVNSTAYGGTQVGNGTTGGVQHALAWFGSAASYVDLYPSLSSLVFPTSIVGADATGIDSAGNIVGYAFDNNDPNLANNYAVLWTLTPDVIPPPSGGGLPEPASGYLLLVGLLFFRRRRAGK